MDLVWPSLTNDEKSFYGHIADHGGTVQVDETGVVRDDYGDVERSDEDEPIPATLEDAVMRQDETGLLQGGRLVLRKRSCCRLQQRL